MGHTFENGHDIMTMGDAFKNGHDIMEMAHPKSSLILSEMVG